jgi:hypothetical protein
MVVFVGGVMSGHVCYAAQLDDVSLPDRVMLDGTGTELQLNGLGYRTKFVFNIYVGALYTEEKVTTRDQVQALTGPKRVVMHMVYDEVSADKMASAWRDGFEDNNSEDKLAALEDRLQILIGYFDTMKAGDVVLLDYIPGTGTRVTIRGEHKGDIAGEDFYAALLDVWLGEEPADDDLKDAMLGIVEQ